MTSAPFNYAPLLPPGLPAPAARFTGLAKYSFVGGNNDPDGVPVDELVEAVTAVLKREGKSLATYNLAHGPQGYGPLREFLVKKLKRDAGIACTVNDLMIVSGSLQAERTSAPVRAGMTRRRIGWLSASRVERMEYAVAAAREARQILDALLRSETGESPAIWTTNLTKSWNVEGIAHYTAGRPAEP